MVTVYFIRHGQAGSRQVYDRLSEVGRRQSVLLGEWLARRSIRFDAVLSGRLNRQRETAEQAAAASTRGGIDFPEIATHPCWDEFDLDAVYAGLAPQIAATDEDFRRQFEELRRQARDVNSAVHRTWSPCDITVVRAWIDGQYAFEGESFRAFVDRVCQGAETLKGGAANRSVAVFTSATPAAVWAAKALDLDGRKIMQLAGVMYNTAVTIVKANDDQVRLFQFNTVPHIETPELLTHR